MVDTNEALLAGSNPTTDDAYVGAEKIRCDKTNANQKGEKDK